MFIHASPQNDLTQLKHTIEENMSLPDSWLSKNSLNINPTKTDFMLVHTQQRRSLATFPINFGPSSIQPSQSVQTLGIIMDKKLT